MENHDSNSTISLTNQQPDYPVITVLVLLLLGIIFGGSLGVGIAYLISTINGLDLNAVVESLSEASPRSDRDFVRLFNLVSHLCSFTLPAVLVVLFLYRDRWQSYLKLDRSPKLFNVILGSFFILSAFPVAQFALWLNQQLPLPEWMLIREDAAGQMIKGILTMDSPTELIFTLFVVAVLPAVGEELVFRGILQQQLQRNLHPISAIWFTAIIFSAIHFQFEGFLARMLLGAVLGYLFYWTRNLWVPIIAHFFTNALQVVAQYATEGQLEDIEIIELDQSQLAVIALASITMLVLGVQLRKWNRTTS